MKAVDEVSVIGAENRRNYHAILFVDPTVSAYEYLVTNVVGDVEVVILNPTQDGVTQISEALAERNEISALHLVSHGSPGSLCVGNTQLNLNVLKNHASQVQAWAKALETNADILLYGCNVAAGEAGKAFVQQLSNLTGANIAASSTLTGSAELGGNWQLDVQTGTIRSSLAFDSLVTNSYTSVFNDNFSNRTILSGVNVSTNGSNITATEESGEPSQSGTTNSVWYSWTAPNSNNTIINTVGSGTNFDTYLSVYTGSALNNLTAIGSDDDSGGNLQSQVSFNAIAGNTYHVAVDGFGSSVGDFVLNIAAGTNNAPTDLSLSGTSVNENVAANTVVGTFSSIDPNTGNTFTYSLVDGTGSTDNTAFSIDGNQLRINTFPDFEAKNSYNIRVQTTDSEGLSYEEALTINVNNVNEAPVVTGSNNFKITSLLASGANALEHNSVTGDDRGGIAVSNSQVFYTGDNNTGRFALSDLSSGTNTGQQYDGIFSNLATGEVFAFGNNTTPLASGGTITTLLGINGATGALSGTSVPLSTPITTGGTTGIFSGYNRAVIYTNEQVYNIDLPSGTVSDLGAMTLSSWFPSESWAIWGVAEYFDNAVHLAYVDTSPFNTIERVRVPDGVTQTIATFSNLNDMAAFTVSPSNNRWYFHHEGSSQFRSGDETVGYADATFSIISAELNDQNASVGSPFNFTFAANTFSDRDGNTLSYSATRSDGTPLPSWLNFNANTRTFIGTPTSSDLGNLSIKVTASDNSLSTSDDFSITVDPSTSIAPTDLSLSATSVDENIAANTVVGTFSTTGPDTGNTFTYSLVSGTGSTDNSAFSIVSNELRINTSTNYETKPSYNIRVRTTDRGGLSYEEVLTINVNNLNETPTLATPIADQTTTVGSVFNYTFPDTTFSDVDGDSLIYTSTVPDWLNFNPATRTFSGTPSSSNEGVVEIPVIASDGTLSKSDTFNLSVLPATPPIRDTSGNDTISGTPGNDRIILSTGINTVRAGNGNDIITGGTDRDILYGDAGNDIINGGSGNDDFYGGGDNDIISGDVGSDRLYGDAGSDRLFGGAGIDRLYGGAGDDLLDAGVGADPLNGGSGADIFVLRSGDGRDTIQDYTDGSDKIGLAVGLSFAQLQFTQQAVSGGGVNTQITHRSTNEVLATLVGISSSNLTTSDFVSV